MGHSLKNMVYFCAFCVGLSLSHTHTLQQSIRACSRSFVGRSVVGGAACMHEDGRTDERGREGGGNRKEKMPRLDGRQAGRQADHAARDAH